jgi:hypothetical protein
MDQVGTAPLPATIIMKTHIKPHQNHKNERNLTKLFEIKPEEYDHRSEGQSHHRGLVDKELALCFYSSYR